MCRSTIFDRGRKAELTVDGTKIGDVVIPNQMKNTDNGFFNVEFAIPEELLKDANGELKSKFVVRLSATENTPNPGLYYLRLIKK